MARPQKHVDLPAIFRGPRVLTLEQLVGKLSLSRATVFRRLHEHGYFSSYNCWGKYLIVKDVANFDSRGLWIWNSARFSEHGTLKQTAEHFIESGERGMTHEEMRDLLGVRLHNTLLDLVAQRRTYRERLGSTFVYLSRRRDLRREQARQRLLFIEENRKPRPSSRQIIAILLELLRDPRARREEIACRCERAGVTLSSLEVDAVFAAYDLDKKRDR